jgi:hypothetical protein
MSPEIEAHVGAVEQIPGRLEAAFNAAKRTPMAGPGAGYAHDPD